MATIGIDLGTTNCCVATIKNGVVEIIPNSSGGRTTPSWISFRNGEVVIGESAKLHAQQFLQTTVYDIKYIIGLKHTDLKNNKNPERVPFVIMNKQDKLQLAITDNKITTIYSPEELSGILLKDLKNCAEQYLNCDIDKAVITVPTYFNDAQREATIDAGKIAGFEAVTLLNEPTAAAIAYGEQNFSEKSRNVLVYDFGGGTFDVSIIKCGKNYEVLAIDGDLQLGGQEITKNLVNYFTSHLKNKHSFDITKHPRKIFRLNAMCENCKLNLTENDSVDVELGALIDDECDDFKLTRKLYNKINKEVFAKTMCIVENCIKRAKLDKGAIDEVVLVGGSTRSVRVAELLEDYFEKPIKRSVNPDEAVAAGAALVASTFNGTYSKTIEFTNITPYSLGVNTQGGLMSVIIPKYSKIPITAKKYFSTVISEQTRIRIKIYSGEDEYTANNKYLGEFLVEDIAAEDHGRVLEETFHVDTNGVLTVTAKDTTTGNSKQLTMTVEKGRLTKAEINQITDRVMKLVKKTK